MGSHFLKDFLILAVGIPRGGVAFLKDFIIHVLKDFLISAIGIPNRNP